uniref:Monocarboxylate transporter n=1 Tax=Timema shepardi TaxID=629360 RepID=A0A7R9AR84_TIMSH|nr:unnamed protein product [Timema shepardi]
MILQINLVLSSTAEDGEIEVRISLATRSIEPSFGLLFGDTLKELNVATTGASVIMSTLDGMINFSGLGVGFATTAGFVALNHYFSKYRGQAVGLSMAGTALGFMVMPQAVQLLLSEYDFQGSVLVLGGVALHSVVGSLLLQPIKWHMRPAKEEEEEDEEEQDLPEKPQHKAIGETSGTSRDHHLTTSHGATREMPRSPRHTSIVYQLRLFTRGENNLRGPGCLLMRLHTQRPRNGAVLLANELVVLSLTAEDGAIEATEKEKEAKGDDHETQYPLIVRPKIEITTVSEDVELQNTPPTIGKRPLMPRIMSNPQMARITSTPNMPRITSTTSMSAAARRRKESVISNISSMDFTGSSFHIHTPVDSDNEDDEENKHNNNIKGKTKKKSYWRRFVTFMDLDLLKDLSYLNILFGLSVFYVAELNFKMIVPFFFANLGYNKVEIAFFLSMTAIADVAARVILPPICDRVKIRRRTLFMVAAIFLGISRSGVIRDVTGSYAACIHSQTVLVYTCCIAWGIEYLFVFLRSKKKQERS